MRLAIILLAIYTLGINLLAFAMYGIDKYKSKHDLNRISEKALLLIAFFGGSVGALLGMFVFHHKTKHLKFRILLPLFFLIHIAVTGALYWYLFVYAR
ncbi:MAG: DUF1294 domain-containing protein [Paludibacteraceae bacterium]|nr:DUF1294 domain-containing protein [Paludibacteraceae bacterium]